MITQANVASGSSRESGTCFHFGPGSRVLQIHSIAFDLYVTSLLAPLVSGATAVLYEREAFGTAERFIAWCDAAGEISTLDIPTSVFHTVVDEMSQVRLHISIDAEGTSRLRESRCVRTPLRPSTRSVIRDLSLHNDLRPYGDHGVGADQGLIGSERGQRSEHVPIGSPPAECVGLRARQPWATGTDWRRWGTRDWRAAGWRRLLR